jgi:hypothetical protein
LARSCDLPRDQVVTSHQAAAGEDGEDGATPQDVLTATRYPPTQEEGAASPFHRVWCVRLCLTSRRSIDCQRWRTGEPLMLAGWDYTFLANEAFVKQLVKDDNKYVIAESGILLRHLIWENCSTVPVSSRVESTWLGLTRHLAVRACACVVSCCVLAANTDVVMQVMRNAIARASYDMLKPLLAVMEQLLAVEDSYTATRVENNIKDLLEIFEDKKKLPKTTEINIKFLVRVDCRVPCAVSAASATYTWLGSQIHKLYEKNAVARHALNKLYLNTLEANYQPLAWVESWLNTHHHDINGTRFMKPPARVNDEKQLTIAVGRVTICRSGLVADPCVVRGREHGGGF